MRYIFCALMAISCSPAVTEQQGAQIIDYTDKLAKCRAIARSVGKDAGGLDVYKDCEKVNGL